MQLPGSSRFQWRTASPVLAAGQEKVLQVLRQEFPTARKIAGDQVTCGDPVLDGPDADVEDLRDIAVAIHRFQSYLLDLQDGFQKRILGGGG